MLLDKTSSPTPETLAGALGPAYRLWQEITSYVATQSPQATSEWKWSGAQFGWSFRLKDKKRNLIYMLPGERSFRVSFALGERAVAAVEASALPDAIKDELRTARRYAEGRPLRLQVAGPPEAAFVKTLVDIKIGI
jgi:hypothetical protein